MRILVIVALACAFIAHLHSPTEAKITVTRKTIYYEAKGTTGAAIYDSMEASKSRLRLPGLGALSTTLTSDLSRDDFRETERGCVLDEFDLNLELVFYYPKWVSRKSASRDVRRAWDDWYRAVVAHEEKHASQMEAAVRRLDTRFKKIARTASGGCPELLDLLVKEIEAADKALSKQIREFEKSEFLSESQNVRLTKALIEAK